MVLRRLVEKYGEGQWSLISTFFPGRIGKQCRERWHHQLNPKINRNAWSVEEERIIVAAHKVHKCINFYWATSISTGLLVLMCLESWSKQLSIAAICIMHMLFGHYSCVILGRAVHSNAHLSCADGSFAVLPHEGQFALRHAVSCSCVC